jgi:DNA-binding Lrp family transcriptional regulator
VHQRVKRLEHRGLILGYGATVNHDEIGLPLTAFISIRPIDPSQPDDSPARLEEVPEIESCWSVAGDESYILKVRLARPSDLRTCWPGSVPPRTCRPARRSCCRRTTRTARSPAADRQPCPARRPTRLAGARARRRAADDHVVR